MVKMAPRQLDIIFENNFLYEIFIVNISEIFSHHVDTVKEYFKKLSEDEISALIIYLY